MLFKEPEQILYCILFFWDQKSLNYNSSNNQAFYTNPFFSNYQGTKEIQGIVLELHGQQEMVKWNPEAFSKMQYLKFLKNDSVHLMHDLKHLPNSLRFLDWSGYSSKSLPSSFQSNKLVKLRLRNSYIERLWKGAKVIQEPLHTFFFLIYNFIKL